jgi:hypothetical protein
VNILDDYSHHNRPVIGGPELVVHEEDGGNGRANEEHLKLGIVVSLNRYKTDLHGRVVEGDKICEQIQIAANEDQQEKHLGTTRNTCTIFVCEFGTA